MALHSQLLAQISNFFKTIEPQMKVALEGAAAVVAPGAAPAIDAAIEIADQAVKASNPDIGNDHSAAVDALRNAAPGETVTAAAPPASPAPAPAAPAQAVSDGSAPSPTATVAGVTADQFNALNSKVDKLSGAVQQLIAALQPKS